jgi:hypothetical protein
MPALLGQGIRRCYLHVVGKATRPDPASRERAVQRAVDVCGVLGIDRLARIPDDAGSSREERGSRTGRRRED